jgi:hypothetical protein
MIPYIDEIQKHSSYVEEFLGISHRPRISEKQFSDAYNVNNDEYPLLSTRKPREELKALYMHVLARVYVDGYAASLILNYIDNKVYFNYKNEFEPLGEFSDGVNYQLVIIGARIVAFPNLYVYNTVTNEGKIFGTDITLAVGTKIDVCVQTSDNSFVEVTDIKGRYNEQNYYLDTYGDVPEVHYYDKDKYTVVDKDNVFLKIENSMIGGSALLDHMKISESLNDVLSFGQILFPNNVIDGAEIHNGYAYVRGIAKVLDLEIVSNTRIKFKTNDGSNNLTDYEKETVGAYVSLNLNYKPLDFVVESQNRLWGCRYRDGINELYASGLGRYDDWTSNDAADSAWTASVGTPGAFTGACVVGSNPIFFKEDYMHKIYPSNIGAHQVVQSEIRGVSLNSPKSLVQVRDYYYYKSRGAVMRFDGTGASEISYDIDAAKYRQAVAGAFGDKYVMYCERDSDKYIFVYDTRYGTWQRESVDQKITHMVSVSDSLVMIYLINRSSYTTLYEVVDGKERVPYMFESGDIGYSDMAKKYLVRLDMRVKLDFGASFNVWIQYDGDGNWHQITRLRGMLPAPRIETVNVMPHRCDHFRIKVTGIGKMRLYSFRKIYESEDE